MNKPLRKLNTPKVKQEGRLITLPCKVGDTVYYIAWHEKSPIKHGTVWQFGTDENLVWASVAVSKTGVVICDVNNLYLTRKAAEAALTKKD